MAQPKIQRNQLNMAEQFRLADWMKSEWTTLKSLTRVEVAAKAQVVLNIQVTDKNVESVAAAAGLEFDPPPRAIRASGGVDPQHTRDMVEAAQLMMEVAQAGQQQMSIVVQQLRAVETRLQELERSMNAAAAS